jgi:hypothetical protein
MRLLGKVISSPFLMTESGEFLLTTLPKGVAQPPESGALPIAEQDLGKTALGQGELAGKENLLTYFSENPYV